MTTKGKVKVKAPPSRQSNRVKNNKHARSISNTSYEDGQESNVATSSKNAKKKLKTAVIPKVNEVFDDLYSKGKSKKVTTAVDNSDDGWEEPDDVDNADGGSNEADESNNEKNEIIVDADSDWVSKLTGNPTQKLTYTEQDDDRLEEKHRIFMPQTKLAKKDQAKDIKLVFLDWIPMMFHYQDKSTEWLEGRWCNICS